MPAADLEFCGRRKKFMVRQFRAVVENGDRKIKLQRERRDRLRDVTGTGNPQFHRRETVSW